MGRYKNGRGVGGHGVCLSPQMHQEYSFRHKSACRTPAESGQEDLTSGKEYIEHTKLSRMKGLGEKNRSVSRTGPALSRWGHFNAGVKSPHQGNCLSQRRNI